MLCIEGGFWLILMRDDAGLDQSNSSGESEKVRL